MDLHVSWILLFFHYSFHYFNDDDVLILEVCLLTLTRLTFGYEDYKWIEIWTLSWGQNTVSVYTKSWMHFVTIVKLDLY